MNRDEIKNGKIVVIGAGNVGASIAYTAVLSGVGSEVVLIDLNKELAKGEALDINHGIAYLRQVDIRDGDFSDCADAQIIVITAGVNRKPGQTRLELAKINTGIAKDIAGKIKQYAKNPILVVVSNPVDVLTYVFTKETGYPADRVIGSGTSLDTSRFRYLIGRHCDIDVRNVHAYIIGEHGDSAVPVWSRANLAGQPFDERCNSCEKQCEHVTREIIFEQTKTAGAEIIGLKGATYYGVALSVVRILKAIQGDERSVLTVAKLLDGDYGMNDVALSLPCVIGRNGIERIIDIGITAEEQKQLENSKAKLREIIDEIY